MAKSSTRRVTSYIYGRKVEASVIFGIFRIFATSKTTADEPLPTIPFCASPDEESDPIFNN